MLPDLRNRQWLYLKAILFVCIGVIASALVLIDQPRLRTAALLAVAIWGFCRAYYFAFYVLAHYVDASYRFSGLVSFVRYLWRSRARE